MPVTVRGGDILFNDGSTQGTAVASLVSGSTVIGSPITQRSESTSYVLSAEGFVVGVPGTITIRFRVSQTEGYYGGGGTGYARIHINGSAVGSEIAKGFGGARYGPANEQSFSVNPGDLIQIGVRGQYGGGYYTDGQFGPVSGSRRNAAFISRITVNYGY